MVNMAPGSSRLKPSSIMYELISIMHGLLCLLLMTTSSLGKPRSYDQSTGYNRRPQAYIFAWIKFAYTGSTSRTYQLNVDLLYIVKFGLILTI